MTAAERRYFSKYAVRNKKEGKSPYLDLFQAIHAQEEYDEAAIKASIAGSSFARNFSFPKSYLYDLILRSLQQYYYEGSLNSMYRSELEKIDLLYGRGFFDHARRILEKGLQRSLRFERPLMVLELIRWKRMLLKQTLKEGLSGQLAELAQLEEHWLKALDLERGIQRRHDQLFTLLQAYRLQSGNVHANDLEEALSDLDRILEASELAFEGRVMALTSKAYAFHLQEDTQAVHATYRMASDCWKEQPWQIKAAPDQYLRTIGALLNSKALVRDYDGLMQEIKALRTRTDLDAKGLGRVFVVTTNLELFYYLNTGRFREASQIGPTVESGFETHRSHLPPSAILGISYNLALANWLSNQPGNALTWVNRILHSPETEVRKDITGFAPLLEKVLFYELGHIDLLESWFRAFRYRSRRGRESNQLEGYLLDLIKGLLNSPDEASGEQYRSTFCEELEAYRAEPGVPQLGLAELANWATDA